jgi:protein gp37
MAARFSDEGNWGHGIATRKRAGPAWTGKVSLVDATDTLMAPLSWRTPRRVFVNSTSDLFHERLSDDDLDHVFAVMLICCLHETRGGHTFQVLTKRAGRMAKYTNTFPAEHAPRLARIAGQMMNDGDRWHDAVYSYVRKNGVAHPLIWLGASVENQACADERVPELLRTNARVRFLSCEPLLEPVDLRRVHPYYLKRDPHPHDPVMRLDALTGLMSGVDEYMEHKIDWVIVGGESGPGARIFDVGAARSLLKHCREAGVPCFVKQLGAWPREELWNGDVIFYRKPTRQSAFVREGYDGHEYCVPANGYLTDAKGGNPAEWPEDLRVRAFPDARGAA